MPTQIELGVPHKSPAQKEPQGEGKSFNYLEFLREVKTEFLKVTWPSKAQVTNEFFSVLVLVAILTGIIFLIDKVFGIIAGFFRGNLFY